VAGRAKEVDVIGHLPHQNALLELGLTFLHNTSCPTCQGGSLLVNTFSRDFLVDMTFHMDYIPFVECEVEYSDEFGQWWNSLTEPEQDAAYKKVGLLERLGPTLSRPHSDVIRSSKHSNMKELIIQHAGNPYRVLYAFDPRRIAVLLLGGNKKGNDKWYEEFVPRADKLYDEHIAALRKEGLVNG
jgi:hypothetical protein